MFGMRHADWNFIPAQEIFDHGWRLEIVHVTFRVLTL
jgi:hypothetical protein